MYFTHSIMYIIMYMLFSRITHGSRKNNNGIELNTSRKIDNG